MLTPERLQEIRERAEKATPGPWDNSTGDVTNWNDELDTYSMEWISNRRQSREQQQRDADFIASARTDIPALLDHIALLERMLAEAHDESAGYRQGYLDGQKALAERVWKLKPGPTHCMSEVEKAARLFVDFASALEPVPFDASAPPPTNR